MKEKNPTHSNEDSGSVQKERTYIVKEISTKVIIWVLTFPIGWFFFFVLKEEFTTDKRKYLIWYLKIYEEQRGLFKVLLALNP